MCRGPHHGDSNSLLIAPPHIYRCSPHTCLPLACHTLDNLRGPPLQGTHFMVLLIVESRKIVFSKSSYDTSLRCIILKYPFVTRLYVIPQSSKVSMCPFFISKIGQIGCCSDIYPGNSTHGKFKVIDVICLHSSLK